MEKRMKLTHLSDDELFSQAKAICHQRSRLLAQLILVLIEVEERRLHERKACSSMFVFCRDTQPLHSRGPCRAEPTVSPPAGSSRDQTSLRAVVTKAPSPLAPARRHAALALRTSSRERRRASIAPPRAILLCLAPPMTRPGARWRTDKGTTRGSSRRGRQVHAVVRGYDDHHDDDVTMINHDHVYDEVDSKSVLDTESAAETCDELLDVNVDVDVKVDVEVDVRGRRGWSGPHRSADQTSPEPQSGGKESLRPMPRRSAGSLPRSRGKGRGRGL
jgi:hypothetical protein